MIETRVEIDDPNVVTGMFPIKNVYASILFDLGIDKSFIILNFRELLSHKSSRLN